VTRLGRLLRMGPAEIAFRGRTGVRQLADRARLALALPTRHESGLARRLAADDPAAPWWTDALADARRLAARGDLAAAGDALRRQLLDRPAPVLPGRPADRDRLLSAMVRLDAGLEGRVVARAEAALAGRYDLLGHQGLDAGRGPAGGPDWHRDAVSSRRAPRLPWSQVPFLDAARVGDHKVIWELSRHQHWLDLALAYRLTGRTAYAARLALEAESWLAENPPKVGIHWASMLELALRGLAWLRALPFVLDAPPLHGLLVARLVGSLDRQMRHVRSHLSVYFSPNTHLIGEALGLLVAGLRLPELAAAAGWRAVGLRTLAATGRRQVLDDGLHAERSAAYHRYTTDFYLEAAAALEAAGPGLGVEAGRPDRAEVVALADRLLDALAGLALPDGSLPALGDDDGGEALPLDGGGPLDARPTLGAGGAWLAERAPGRAATLLGLAGGVPARAALLFGPERAECAAALRAPVAAPVASRLFADGGYVVMRGGEGTGDLALMDVGPLGDDGRAGGSAGHAHADTLQALFVLRRVPRVIDPGTYTYTAAPAWRDALRATAAHATLTVDGQSSSLPAGPFRWATQARVTRHLCALGGPLAVIDASHDGYRRLDPPVLHRRVLVHGPGPGWWVLDLLLPAEAAAPAAVRRRRVEATWPLGLLPGEGDPAPVEGGFSWGSGESAACLLVAPAAGAPAGLRTEVLRGGPPGPGWVSPRHGAIRPGAALRFGADVAGPFACWWWLGPADVGRMAHLAPLAVETDGNPGLSLACSLRHAGGVTLVVWSDGDLSGGRLAGLALPLAGRLTVACLDPSGTLLARHSAA
jgi:uncharacterized heparinase superfamily protein